MPRLGHAFPVRGLLTTPPASPADPITPSAPPQPPTLKHSPGAPREQKGQPFLLLLLEKGISLPHPQQEQGHSARQSRATSTPLPGKIWLWQERCWFHSGCLLAMAERASFSRQHCMLVYKPSPARLASVSVQFPHGAPFCRSTLVKTVSSFGRRASSSLAHAQTRFGFCSRREGLDPGLCHGQALRRGAVLQDGAWRGPRQAGAHAPTAALGQDTAWGPQWRVLPFLLRAR